MRVEDLGDLDGPVLIFGGPYSNFHATHTLFEMAQLRNIPRKQMICTGDTVAYCGDPAKTVALIREVGCSVIAGNCEIQLANNQMDCGCGFEVGTTCDLLSAGWYAHADREIGLRDRRWMAKLPDLIVFRHNGLSCAVIHGGVSDISRFLWKNSSEVDFRNEVKCLESEVGGVDVIFSGHSGIVFERQFGALRWINAGAIGLPQNDGLSSTRFTIFEKSSVTFHKLDYDFATAQKKMRMVGLTQGYDLALETGFWPSEEVLPEDLRRSASASG